MGTKESSRRTNIFLGERHVSLFSRITAKCIDLVIVLALYFLFSAIWAPLGVMVATIFCGLQDGMGVGQSFGKRILGVRVVDDQRGLPGTYRHSLLRNLSFMLMIPLAAVPLFWIFLILVALPLLLLEMYLVVSLDSGIRLGDVLANTLVVEYLEDSLVAFR